MHPDEIPIAPEPMEPPRRSILAGRRRMVATALVALGLLTAGGVATVAAASPAPSGSPSASGGASGSQAPAAHNCPAHAAASPSASSS